MNYYLIFIVDFFLLLFVSYYIRHRYLRDAYAATSAGAIVMALSVFVWALLPQLPGKTFLFAPYLTLEIIIVWLFIAESYVKCYLGRHFYIHMRDLLNRFNMGTWSCSTALLAILCRKVFADWEEIAWILGLIATALWIEYLHISIHDLRILARKQMTFKLNGSLLLPAITTQTIVIMIYTLARNWFPASMSITLLLFGYASYLGGLILLIRSFWQTRTKQTLGEWSHENAYIHAGLSITGIACVFSEIIPASIIMTTWVAAAILFVLVESFAFIGLLQATFKNGLKSIVSYDVSQWTRVFAYAGFYAFALNVLHMPNHFSHLQIILQMIVKYGQYIVTLLLLVQLGIFFHAKYKPAVIKRFPQLQKHER